MRKGGTLLKLLGCKWTCIKDDDSSPLCLWWGVVYVLCISLDAPWYISIATRSTLPCGRELRRKYSSIKWDRRNFCVERGRKRAKRKSLCSFLHWALTQGMQLKKVSGWYSRGSFCSLACSLHSAANVYEIRLEGCYTCIWVEVRTGFISASQRKIQRHEESCPWPTRHQSQNTTFPTSPIKSFRLDNSVLQSTLGVQTL